MLDVLRQEGLTDLEFAVITYNGVTWENHAAGYEEATFPVMPDSSGVFYMYGANPYDVILVDKKGRLVSKESNFSSAARGDQVMARLRELHEE
jgi:hypothetical protein